LSLLLLFFLISLKTKIGRKEEKKKRRKGKKEKKKEKLFDCTKRNTIRVSVAIC